MSEIIPHDSNECNNYFSSLSKKSLKLHSSDIAYLLILKWFHERGLQCYLSKEQWPVWLERYGGKAVHYRKQKSRWSKMRLLGYAKNDYQNGNRNLHMVHYITDSGLEALEVFLKNGPSKTKKPILEVQKTAPPLKSDLKNYENNIEALIVGELKRFGIYDGFAKRLAREHSEQEITNAIQLTASRNVKNPGAYIARILTNPLKPPIFQQNGITMPQRGQTMNAKKDKTQFTNVMTSQDLAARALEQARAYLKSQGIEPPIYDSTLDPCETYDRIRGYAEQEAALIVKYMREPSGPRPVVFDSTQSGNGWTGYND